MEEKKLTDEANRFLLDLRCCIYHNCAFCSQWNNGFEEDDCREEMLNRAKNFIHRLHETIDKQKSEIEKLHTLTDMQEANVNTLFENNMGLRKEIERLHKTIDEEVVILKAVKAAENSQKTMKMLVESIGCVQKDTAKEILCELLDIEAKDEDYKMFFLDVCEKLEKFAQKYGVEVE